MNGYTLAGAISHCVTKSRYLDQDLARPSLTIRNSTHYPHSLLLFSRYITANSFTHSLSQSLHLSLAATYFHVLDPRTNRRKTRSSSFRAKLARREIEARRRVLWIA
jgi:hypothetical protein